MDEITISNALVNDKFCSKYYKNTVSCDLLPAIKPLELYIVNDQPSNPDPNINGSHWLLVHSINPQQIEVLCSGGSQFLDNSFIKKRVKEYCDKFNLKYYYFPKPTQNSYTSSCGAFILLFSYCICRGIFGSEILEYFFKGPVSFQRDFTVCHIVKNLFYIDRGSVETIFLDVDFLKKLDSTNGHIGGRKWPKKRAQRQKNLPKESLWHFYARSRNYRNDTRGAGEKTGQKKGERGKKGQHGV